MIRTLNLDTEFIPVPRPEIEFNFITFNGGELHIKINNNIDYTNVDKVIISHRIKSGNDIMQILISKDAIERKGVKHFDLIIPYIPYARQDRLCVEGESFTLQVFCKIINSMNFDNVYVLDAHSDVAPALLNNCINLSNQQYVLEMLRELYPKSQYESSPILVSPDSGANKKINILAEYLNKFNHISVVKCDKVRDVRTGNLTGFEVFAADLKCKDCIIVDDICDGGRTFIGIAEELKKKNAGNIYLFVTHGIFSNEFDELNKYFTKIYCTNSFRDIENSNIKQFKVQL